MDIDKQHGLLSALIGLLQPAEPHTDPMGAGTAFDMHIEEILESFLVNERIGHRVSVWVQKVAAETYAQEISIFVWKDAGFQFSVQNASISQLEMFDLNHLADIIQEWALGLWALFGVLLAADAQTNKHWDWEQKRRGEGQSRQAAAQPTDHDIDGDGDTTMHNPDNPEIGEDSEDEYWKHVEALPDDMDEDKRVDKAMKH
jgi:hypothetical protein